MSSYQKTKQILKDYDFRLTKSLGQNFLIDEKVLDEIIKAAELKNIDNVLEIGAGIGILTANLAKNTKNVLSVEIDKKLLPILSKTLSGYENIIIVNQDILKIDAKQLLIDNNIDDTNGIKVVANLPYYITTPIIMKLLSEDVNISLMVLMMQEEVADRLNAQPSTKAYGSLSVAVQYFCDTKMICKVPSTSFYPSPRVNSCVIALKPSINKRVCVKDEELFFKIVKGSFAKRRKTILNSLSGYANLVDKEKIDYILRKSGIDPRRRGETLDINEFGMLANNYYDEYIKN